jgi:hypothetical protein
MDDRELGRLGLPPGPDTNMDDYNRGRMAASQMPGVAFTLLIIAPFLFLVYPVLGGVVMGTFVGVLYLLSLTRLPTAGIFLVGVILGICGFFPAYKLEAMASQFKLYRAFRTLLRPISIFALTVALRSGAAFDLGHQIDWVKIAGDKFIEGMLAAILFHYILRRADRLYFAAETDVRRQQERLAKGLPDQRPLLKRFWYSLCWIIPVVAILNLIIRLFVDGFTEGPQDRIAFYQHYSMFVYMFDFVGWSVLSLTGILPGTAKVRKYVVEQ